MQPDADATADASFGGAVGVPLVHNQQGVDQHEVLYLDAGGSVGGCSDGL